MLKNWNSNTINGVNTPGGLAVDNLLQEDGFALFQEDGSFILI